MKRRAKEYRLPTEAEWEYAASGGKHSKQYNPKNSGLDNIYKVAWYVMNSGSSTHPVVEKDPNRLGIYDMSGNVWEWCSDAWYKYSPNAQTNLTHKDQSANPASKYPTRLSRRYAACRDGSEPSRPHAAHRCPRCWRGATGRLAAKCGCPLLCSKSQRQPLCIVAIRFLIVSPEAA